MILWLIASTTDPRGDAYEMRGVGPQAIPPRIHSILGILGEKHMCYLNQQVSILKLFLE